MQFAKGRCVFRLNHLLLFIELPVYWWVWLNFIVLTVNDPNELIDRILFYFEFCAWALLYVDEMVSCEKKKKKMYRQSWLCHWVFGTALLPNDIYLTLNSFENSKTPSKFSYKWQDLHEYSIHKQSDTKKIELDTKLDIHRFILLFFFLSLDWPLRTSLQSYLAIESHYIICQLSSAFSVVN